MIIVFVGDDGEYGYQLFRAIVKCDGDDIPDMWALEKEFVQSIVDLHSDIILSKSRWHRKVYVKGDAVQLLRDVGFQLRENKNPSRFEYDGIDGVGFSHVLHTSDTKFGELWYQWLQENKGIKFLEHTIVEYMGLL